MSAPQWRKFHVCMMAFWIVLFIPTYFFWQKSILLVLICSLYANFAGHFGAWQASRAEDVSANNPPPE